MDDYECLSMNPKDQSSFTTQSTSFPVSMTLNSSIEKYTKESVMLALKYKNEYTIFDKKSNAVCWSIFGLPAKILGSDKYEIISKFFSCQFCFQTYSCSSSTFTLSSHQYPILSSKHQSTMKVILMSKSTSLTTTNDASNSVQSVNSKPLVKLLEILFPLDSVRFKNLLARKKHEPIPSLMPILVDDLDIALSRFLFF